LRDLDWEMLIYFMTVANNYTDIWDIFTTKYYILCSFGTFSGFGVTYQEKSGNPANYVQLYPKW
jgi:hypothetical protein